MRMLTQLRQLTESADDETTRIITVRVPRSLHAALQTEAHDEETSMNQLCITKLLKPGGGCDF